MAGAYAVIMSVTIEIGAVSTGMGVYTVQKNPNPQLLCGLTQRPEILHGAQNGVRTEIVSGVITMVGAGLHNGIEIQNPHAQLLQIGQLLGNALQGTAVKIIGHIVRFSRSGLPFYRCVPFRNIHGLSKILMIGDALLGGIPGIPGKPVGENLIHHTVTKPCRGGEGSVINGQSESGARGKADPPHLLSKGFAQQAGHISCQAETEIIAQRHRGFRQGNPAGKIAVQFLHTMKTVSLQNQGCLLHQTGPVPQPQGNGRFRWQSADGKTIAFFGAVVADEPAQLGFKAADNGWVRGTGCLKNFHQLRGAGLHGGNFRNGEGPRLLRRGKSAGGDNAPRPLPIKIMFVQQYAQQFRRSQRGKGTIQKFRQPVHIQSRGAAPGIGNVQGNGKGNIGPGYAARGVVDLCRQGRIFRAKRPPTGNFIRPEGEHGLSGISNLELSGGPCA